MIKLQYEKNNTIKTLKNEIYGINQLIDILEKVKQFDFSKFNDKIINIKLEKALREFTGEYIKIERGHFGYELSILIKNRYNKETKSYIGWYDSYTINLITYITLSPSNKEQIRLLASNIINAIQEDIDKLVRQLMKLENELGNIDNIILEIEKLNELVLDFKKDKSSFLLDNFKSIRNYY